MSKVEFESKVAKELTPDLRQNFRLRKHFFGRLSFCLMIFLSPLSHSKDDRPQAPILPAGEALTEAPSFPVSDTAEHVQVTAVTESSPTANVDSTRPNVLFIAVDDLNDWIGALDGHPDAITPNIDKLAQRGVLFTNAHCPAPACNPSRAALMTGIRPHSSGVYLNEQPWRAAMPNAVTLPQHFMAHGYTALGCGKIYHYPDAASWNSYLSKRDAKGDPRPSGNAGVGGIRFAPLTESKDEDMNDHLMVDWAIRQLKAKHSKPFFLACGIFRPHMPWYVPQKYFDMYPLDQISLPKTITGDLDDLPAAGLRMALPDGDHARMLRSGRWKEAVQAYLASVTFADFQVGRLIEAFDQSSYAKNTVIALWGDHGWHLGEKEHWRKFALWEEATKAPLLFVAPGITRPNSRCDAPVDFMNIYPTLADICGLPAIDQLDGVTMKALLQDPNTPWARPALTTHGRLNHSLRTRTHRYIRYADGSEELYDHRVDSWEWKNIAGTPDGLKIIDQLKKWLPTSNAPNAESDPRIRSNPIINPAFPLPSR